MLLESSPMPTARVSPAATARRTAARRSDRPGGRDRDRRAECNVLRTIGTIAEVASAIVVLVSP
jgi:hypothetical protein